MDELLILFDEDMNVDLNPNPFVVLNMFHHHNSHLENFIKKNSKSNFILGKLKEKEFMLKIQKQKYQYSLIDK
jgi:hypothetical protein